MGDELDELKAMRKDIREVLEHVAKQEDERFALAEEARNQLNRVGMEINKIVDNILVRMVRAGVKISVGGEPLMTTDTLPAEWEADYEPPEGGLSSRIDPLTSDHPLLPHDEPAPDPGDPLATLVGIPDFPADLLVDFDVRRRARLAIKHTKRYVHVVIPKELWTQFPHDEEALLIPPVVKGGTDEWDRKVTDSNPGIHLGPGWSE